jgi:hypothetical protein
MQQSQIELSRPPSILRILVPLLLTTVVLIYCWIKLLTFPFIPQWQHYSATFGFLSVVLLFVKSRRWGTIALGLYLIIAITTVFSLTYNISYISFIFPIGNLTAWGIFTIYLLLNGPELGGYYLDYQESKKTV